MLINGQILTLFGKLSTMHIDHVAYLQHHPLTIIYIYTSYTGDRRQEDLAVLMAVLSDIGSRASIVS